ncbi:MAG: hypothetical protein HFK03_04455 [Clostridia bacterium]|jgi:hypothetical protein|nr:hypothetical protein [Clostridia bacterium]
MKELKELKARRPLVCITDEDFERLKEIAENYDTTPNRIIEQFIYDITCSDYSGGSDERDLADDWLSRSRYNF